jgi:hypothetical protein
VPKDPLPASSPGKLPTNSVDIGHVAPSFPDEELWNTLVVRAAYRIALRLGDIDALFSENPGTEKGRMQRLQVLGLFYWPLDHTKAAQAFRGRPGTPANAATDIPAVDPVMGAWEYFWRRILGQASEAGADDKLKIMIEDRILDGLPPAAEDPVRPKLDNFAKIRIPGGYSILRSWQNMFLNFNVDPAYAFSLGDDLYALETRFRAANPALGKIPLVATVEKLDPYTMEWKPAKDQWVYFQLQEPYKLPDFDPAKDVNDPQQFNRPPLRETSIGPPGALSGAGPHALTDSEENPTAGATKPNAADPQKRNAHKDRGGLRGHGDITAGSDVAGHIFAIASTRGFNAVHSPARATAPDLYEVAKAVTPDGAKHRHAVKAKTNDRGEAGVIFIPSRCGGDTYKIRAYLGPADPANPKPHESDGAGARAVRVDTGTMVVWRSLRISRYVQQPVNGVNANLLAEVNNATYNLPTSGDYLRRGLLANAALNPAGMENIDLGMRVRAGYSTKVTLGDPFDSLPVNFAKAFMEVEIDPGGARETMTAADWNAARRMALADAAQAQSALGLNLDLPRLFYMEPGAPAISESDSVVHMPMRTPEAYNALVPAARRTTAPGNTTASIRRLFSEFIVPGFARYFSNSGYVPGLCIVQGGYGGTWQLIGFIGSNSGWSLEYRVGTVWAGQPFYQQTVRVLVFPAAGAPAIAGVGPPWLGYNTTANACHELGHVMLRLHGPGADVNRGEGGGASAAVHDSISSNQSVCVMSYKSCEGQFCAKCLFAFRGWTGLP